jgi:hypothetical protein
MEPYLDRYAHITQLLASGFLFLKDLGFVAPAIRVESSRMLGETLVLRFASTHAKRTVEVGYVSASPDRLAALSVFLCAKTGERFSLEDWVRQNLPTMRLPFTVQTVADEASLVTQFCSSCEDILCGPLRSTLLGEAWVDVEMDWKGYR